MSKAKRRKIDSGQTDVQARGEQGSSDGGEEHEARREPDNGDEGDSSQHTRGASKAKPARSRGAAAN
jgi:hypothetical protein